METQEDSLDLSYLKKAALGVHEFPWPTRPNTLSPAGCSQALLNKSICGEANPGNGMSGDNSCVSKPPYQNLHPSRPIRPHSSGNADVIDHMSSQQMTWKTVPEFPEGDITPAESLSGDTQPVSQSAYDDILNAENLAEDEDEPELAQINGLDGTDGGTTQKTLREGDTGHLDLLADFEYTSNNNRLPVDGDDGSVAEGERDHEIGESSPTHFQPFPESQRFIAHTPATKDGQSHIDNLTTPSISRNPFTQDNKTPGSVMALSQVFNATQAVSSPAIANNIDPFSDMPSPNIPIQPRTTTSILTPHLSSASRLGFIEPQADYVSMKESQAEREKLVHRSDSALNHQSSSASDDEFQREGQSIRKRIRQRQTDNEVFKQFASVTAPPRPDYRKNIKIGASSSPPPLTRGVRARAASHPVLEEKDGAVKNSHIDHRDESEVETEQEDGENLTCVRGSQRLQASGEEDKENIDTGPIQASNTAASAHDALSQALEFERSPSVHRGNYTEIFRSFRDDSPLRDPTQPSIPVEAKESPQIETVYGTQMSVVSGTKPAQQQDENQIHDDRQNSISNDLDGESSPTQRASDQQTSSPPPIKIQIQSSPPKRHSGPTTPAKHHSNTLQSSHKSDELIPPDLGMCSSPSPKIVDSFRSCRKSREVAQHENGDSESKNMNKVVPGIALVHGTPVQDLNTGTDFQRVIPETSPANQQVSSCTVVTRNECFDDQGGAPLGNGTHGDGDASDYDDSLPVPPRFRSSGPLNPLRASKLQKRGISQHFSTILSSPSGRQRRRMTDIASDESPQRNTTEVPLEDIGFITADDRIFQSVVSGPEEHPTKRRKGNDSRRIRRYTRTCERASTTEPVGVQERTLKSAEVVESNLQSGSPCPPNGEDRPHKELQRCDRTANTWDMDSSTQARIRRNEIPASDTGLNTDSRKANRIRGNKDHHIAEAVVIYNSSSSSPAPVDKTPRLVGRRSLQSDKSDSIGPLDFQTDRSSEQIVAPNNVFAFFNGRPHGYYPATCVGISGDTSKPRYSVYFEGSNQPVDVDSNGVKSLELRVNDLVKVNLPNTPRVPHFVVGFKNKQASCGGEYGTSEELNRVTSDVYGYSTVVVQRKLQKIPPNGQKVRSIAVPISSICLDKGLWSRLGKRPYSFTSPSNHISGTRPAVEQSSSSRAPRVSRTPGLGLKTSGLFSKMAFVLNYGGNKKKMSKIESLISNNGGSILKDGFDELFESVWPPATLTANRNGAGHQEADVGDSLKLTYAGKQVGFACLITDQPSRRFKYMQALALNLPCLAGQWIQDCVDKEDVLDWEPYLLPAGPSVFLEGTVRSRILSLYPTAMAYLPDTITTRPKFLAGQSVLFVMGRGEIAERRKMYPFLIYALGSESVYPVQTLQAAVDLLTKNRTKHAGATQRNPGGSWDWIFVGDQSSVPVARNMLLKFSEPSKSGSGRKRGRPIKGSDHCFSSNGKGMDDVIINGKTVRILDSDYLCETLILGKLF